VALYKQANEALHDVRKTFPDREVTDRSAGNLLSECRDQWNRALDSKVQVERELESLETRILRYEQVMEALREVSQKECVPENVLETARELDHEFREMARRVEEAETLPSRMEETGKLAARQQEVRRKVTLIKGRGESIECGADLRSLFESMQNEQDGLMEERSRLQERLAVSGGERAQAEHQMERLQGDAAEWRESRRLVRILEDGFGTAIGDGPALENLKAGIEEDLTTGGDRLRRLEEERETKQKRVLDLEFGGGHLDESLVRLRDLVDGRLAAELYDEVSEADAATVEARLGPLHGALLVGDVPEAARTIAQEPDRPDDVWFL
jgi:chromosome condensin MukBEF ATPase and DNA-binding subunit MukB